MCTCSSCRHTDSFAGKGFADWPRGEPKGAAKSKAEYSAHWSHCGAEFGRKLAALSGSPFPCRGTVHGDPRIWYHFPGGQVGKARHGFGHPLQPRRDKTLPEVSAANYVDAFCTANNLT
jgi:hypothetical protein